ncbi:glycosyltransferase [uncultured Methanobrevibacter sp.]|uniref:glycosyltransferase family 2 protein n=1 Tax=uncultured Methanobrevibacter sp. TaxID=253161 RepID=UPI0025D1D196|nr:glycosyltransferase [uncultured Methanobrevibacter sp.]
MYKISLIIPVFNIEKYLEKNFKSIKNQSIGFSNIEVIFVDDCSSDNSSQIIDKWEDDYINVKVIHLDTNSGYGGKPRNIGILNASSDYVLFLDGDDYLNTDGLEKLYDAISQDKDIDIAIGGYTRLNSDNTIKEKKIQSDDKTSIISNPKEELKLMDLAPALASKLFRKDLLTEKNIKFREDISAQDLIFVNEAYFKSSKLILINNYSVYNYNIRDSEDKSVSHNINLKTLKNSLKAYIAILKLCKDFEINEYMTTALISNNLYSYVNRIRDNIEDNTLKKEDIDELFESDDYKTFKNSSFFEKNYPFNVFFSNLEYGDFKNNYFLRIIKHNKIYEKRYHDNIKEYKRLKAEYRKINRENKKLKKTQNEIFSSTSWKITKPLRNIKGKLN